MLETLKKISEQLNGYWSKLTKSQRIKLISIVSASLISIVVLTIIFSRPTMVPLYSTPLTQEQAGEVTQQLDTDKYTYSVQDQGDGEIINVDQKYKNKIKIALSVAGIPKSKGLTWSDVFDNTSLSTPNEERQEKFLIAKQDDIARTLMEMEGIKDASVKIAIPDKTPFVEDQNTDKTSASVKLTLEDTLSSQQIQGIVRFVAGSVDGLNSKNVTIIDNEGNQLTGNNSNSQGNGVVSQLTIKDRQTEKYRQQVQNLFDGMFDSVKVGVNLDINFDNQVIDATKYSTNNQNGNGYMSHQETSSEKGTGVEGTAGAAGTSSNVTVTYPQSSGNNNYTMDKKSNNVDYKIDQTKTQTVKATGVVVPSNSSVSVMLYKKGKEYTDKNAYLNAKTQIKTRTDLLGLVRDATGIKNVTVREVILPIYTPSQTINIGKIISSYGPFAIAAIIILALAIGLLRKEKSPKGAEAQNIEVEDVDMINQPMNGPSFEAIVSDDKEDLPDIEVSKDSEVQGQIDKFIKDKPDAVAQLLKNWLNEDWE